MTSVCECTLAGWDTGVTFWWRSQSDYWTDSPLKLKDTSTHRATLQDQTTVMWWQVGSFGNLYKGKNGKFMRGEVAVMLSDIPTLCYTSTWKTAPVLSQAAPAFYREEKSPWPGSSPPCWVFGEPPQCWMKCVALLGSVWTNKCGVKASLCWGVFAECRSEKGVQTEYCKPIAHYLLSVPNILWILIHLNWHVLWKLFVTQETSFTHTVCHHNVLPIVIDEIKMCWKDVVLGSCV